MAEIEKNAGTVGDAVVEEAVNKASVETKSAEKTAKKAVDNAKSKPKSKKTPFTAKIKKAWREFKAEFKKIVWSSKKDTFNNTILVIVSIVVVAIVIGALDLGFSKLLELLGKIV